MAGFRAQFQKDREKPATESWGRGRGRDRERSRGFGGSYREAGEDDRFESSRSRNDGPNREYRRDDRRGGGRHI